MFRLAALLILITAPAVALDLDWAELDSASVCEARFPAASPPDFASETCRNATADSVDPQGRAIWIRVNIELEADDISRTAPSGLFLSGAMSTTAYLNGELLGSNGQPGQDRVSEIPGDMDAVLFIPPDLMREGSNELVMLMSSHHGILHLNFPVHIVAIGEFASPTERIIREYWPSLINLGVFILAIIVFGGAAIRSEGRENAVILTLLALFITGQLLLETSRGLFGYAYPLHSWRLIGVVVSAAGFALIVFAHILKRFTSFRAEMRWTAFAVMAVISALIAFTTPSFDPKAIAVILFPLSVASLVLLWAIVNGTRTAWFYLMASLAAAGLSFFFSVSPSVFLDTIVFYFASTLILFWFYEQAMALRRARHRVRTETARAERLEMALEQVRQRADPAQLQLTSAGKMQRINTEEILHLRAAGDYIELHFRNGGTQLFTSSLNEIDNRLPDTFLRIHRSHLVNTAAVKSLTRAANGVGELELTDGTLLPVSRRIMPKVRSVLAG